MVVAEVRADESDFETEVTTMSLVVEGTLSSGKEFVTSGVEEGSGFEDEVVARRAPELEGKPELAAPPGGGTALEGSARAPTPQGIFSPEPG